jgi:O-antigen ligase
VYLVRPRVAGAGSRALDVALLCAVAVPALQLIPLPAPLRRAMSPRAGVVEEALLLGGGTPGSRPLSIDPAATAGALAIALLAVGTFWLVRELAARGHVRTPIRTIAWTGLAMVVLAVAALGSGPGKVWGIWETGTPAALPYGPFVNRNHTAAWLVMALPLVTGYIFARFHDRSRSGGAAAAVDTPMVWLTGSAIVLLAGIVISLSRSAAVGTAAGAAFAAVLISRRGAVARWGLALSAVVALGIVLANPRTADLGQRFDNANATATWDRPQIWRETLPIARDFAATGTGAGAFGRAMLVYQQGDRRLFFNQAHNHLLQLAVEGGLLLLVPLTAAAVFFARQVYTRLAADRSPMFWIRLGATGGIVGVLVQSLWETALRMPANALLFATIAALAVHDGAVSRSRPN